MVKIPVPPFKDVTKRSSDLLTKDFPADKQEYKVEFKGVADNDVKIESNVTTKIPDGSSVGTVNTKYTNKPYGTTTSLEINTKKEAKLEISMEDYHAPGLKTGIALNYKPEDKWVTVTSEYKHENGNVSAQVDYGKSAGIMLEGSASVGGQGFTLAGNAQYQIGSNDNELKKLHSILGYSTSDFDVALFAKHTAAEGKTEEKNIMGLSYFHKFAPNWIVGGEATFDTIPPEASPKLVFGSQYKMAEDTIIKAKFDTDAKLGLSYIQQYNKYTRFNLGGTIDTKNLAKTPAQFGFTVTFSNN